MHFNFYDIGNMTGKLSTLFSQAVKTFAATRGTIQNLIDHPNFQELVTLVDNLQFIDIHREPDLIATCEYAMNSNNPLEYLPLYDDRKVTIGIFILRQGEKIPLHDHPGMHGILKVLCGELSITSYNMPSISLDENKSHYQFYFNNPIGVTKNPEMSVTAVDKCCVLTPSKCNAHEVKCIKGPAAFLDILAPPYGASYAYNSPRSCHYFEEIASPLGNGIFLKQIPNPAGF